MRNIGFDYNEEADYGYGHDYYGEDGCCLICSDSEEGCMCFGCKCRKCVHYLDGRCTYPRCTGEKYRVCGLKWKTITEKAILVCDLDSDFETWIPLEHFFRYRDKYGEIYYLLPDWLIIKAKLVDYCPEAEYFDSDMG